MGGWVVVCEGDLICKESIIRFEICLVSGGGGGVIFLRSVCFLPFVRSGRFCLPEGIGSLSDWTYSGLHYHFIRFGFVSFFQ